jgi:hypothetical protein
VAVCRPKVTDMIMMAIYGMMAELESDLGSIADRMEIRSAIQNGDVDKAMERVNDLNPELLETNPSLYFHLQQQRLIELIRNGKVSVFVPLGAFLDGTYIPRRIFVRGCAF